jgi:tRNA (guanine10-N2)-methyltransferase
MDYLVRLVQLHEDFRLAEIRSLASFFSIQIEIVSYSTDSPFLILRILSYPASGFPSAKAAARGIISRSVLSWGIYELWGMTSPEGEPTYAALHADVRTRTNPDLWSQYREPSFKFSIDAYCGKRSPKEQTEIINSFRYLGFEGPIRMQNPDVEFTIFEEWSLKSHQPKTPPGGISTKCSKLSPNDDTPISSPARAPHRLFLGLLLSLSPRHPLTLKHSLKTRPYISTTSMDATLALLSANLAHAGPGCMVYDPFVGTGGFLVAAAEFGACVWGSDIDGRSFRGTGGKAGGKKGNGCEEGVGRNFHAYGLQGTFGDCFVSDLIHSPLRRGNKVGVTAAAEGGGGWLDAIICDPPYGVREGLKVLGTREPRPDGTAALMIDGVPAHTLPGYVAPKKPYSFEKMLDDILAFAAETLVAEGRLAFWMPSANEDDEVLHIPRHRNLELMECCVQRFYKWSRRLLVYRRRRRGEMGGGDGCSGDEKEIGSIADGTTASDLNPFRRKYFRGVQT